MEIQSWKTRLLKAIEDTGRSDREISLAMRKGPNFVNQFRGERTPSVENLIALCQEINVSLSYIFLGADITREMEEMLTLFSTLPPDSQEHLIGLMRTLLSNEAART